MHRLLYSYTHIKQILDSQNLETIELMEYLIIYSINLIVLNITEIKWLMYYGVSIALSNYIDSDHKTNINTE